MATLKFKGWKFDTQDLPGLTHKLLPQKEAHSRYNFDWQSTNLPNRISNTLVKALVHMYKNRILKYGERTYVEIPAGMNYSGVIYDICVIGKRVNGRYAFKCCLINSAGVSTPFLLDEKGAYTAEECGAVTAALLPFALEDDEANGLYRDIYSDICFLSGEKNMPKDTTDLSKKLLILTDNLYRRSEKLPTSDPAALVMSANQISTLRQTELSVKGSIDLGNFDPVHFQFQGAISEENFEGKYAYQARNWTDSEKALIPKIRGDYVMPSYVPKICGRMKATTKYPSPMRTVLLSGPAGAGKTEASRAILAGIGLPYLVQTCGEGTEFLDLIGQVMPAGQSSPVSFEDIRKALALPNTDDIINDPESAYEKMYGVSPDGVVDEGELLHEVCQRTVDEVRKLGDAGKDFIYIESPLIKAVKNGYGFELQEVDMLKRPSIIVGLNALLESGHNSIITLPTGEIIRKHPDCTIIFTDNGNYEGSRKLNQAVLSRMSMVYLLDDPTADEMRSRAMSRLHFPNEVLLGRMTKVIKDIQRYIRDEDITDGVCGQRELENWAMSVMVDAEIAEMTGAQITDDMVHDCAIETVINKASQDPDDIARIRTACLDKEFVG